METITIPVEVVDKGKDAAWLYLYLARAKARGDTPPSERMLADLFGIGRTQLRNLLKAFDKPPTNHSRTTHKPLTNQTTIDNQCFGRQNEPLANHRQTTDKPLTNQKGSSPSSSPPIPPTTTPTTQPKEQKKDSPKGEWKEKQKGLAQRQKEFYDSLIPFVERYGKQMVRAFYDRWSEPNLSGTKMKKEMERTWDTARRLASWERLDYSRYRTSDKPSEIGKVLTERKNKDYEGW